MEKVRVSTNAIVALVLSIFAIFTSIVVIGILFAIPAVIYGHIALSEIRRSDRAIGGEGAAIGGLIVGYTSMALSVLCAMIAGIIIWIACRQDTSDETSEDEEELVADIDEAGPDCVYTQVLAQLSLGRQSLAETILDTACTTYPDDQRLLFAKATCAHSRFSKRLSTHMMKELARMDSETVEGRCAQAVLGVESGRDVAKHFGELSLLLDQNPTNPFVLWITGVECRTLARADGGTNYSAKGAECYRRLLQQWEVGPVLVHQTYANILSEELGRHEEALPHRRLAVQLEPKAWTYQGLGNNLLRLKRYEEANVAFAKCTELAPDDAQYWRNWAYCLYCQGNYNESIVKCRRATELNPREPQAWNIWGDNLRALEQNEEAIRMYARHVEIDPGDRDTLNTIASLRAEVASRKEFARCLTRLKALQPADATRIDVYSHYTTNLVFRSVDRATVESFCAALRSLSVRTNNPPVMLKNPCDVFVTMRDGTRHGLQVSMYTDDSLALCDFNVLEADRNSLTASGRCESRSMAAWFTSNVHMPRSASRSGRTNNPPDAAQTGHTYVSNRPPESAAP